MITPTIGRKIWFWPNQTADASYTVLDAKQAFDASVVFVAKDERVNITFSDHTGTPFIRHNVLVHQGGEPVAAGTCYCTWMPYQQSAAAAAAPAAFVSEKTTTSRKTNSK